MADGAGTARAGTGEIGRRLDMAEATSAE